MSMNDYEILRNYAEVGTVLCPYNCLCVCTCQIACVCHVLQEIGVLVWKNDGKRLMVVSRAGHDQVKRFWKNKGR